VPTILSVSRIEIAHKLKVQAMFKVHLKFSPSIVHMSVIVNNDEFASFAECNL
jgi:hypothetical protein